jgi:hypothetical protein
LSGRCRISPNVNILLLTLALTILVPTTESALAIKRKRTEGDKSKAGAPIKVRKQIPHPIRSGEASDREGSANEHKGDYVAKPNTPPAKPPNLDILPANGEVPNLDTLPAELLTYITQIVSPGGRGGLPSVSRSIREVSIGS